MFGLESLSISIPQPKRGKTERDRDNAVFDNHLLSVADIGVYCRIVRAIDEGVELEFYIDDQDDAVLESVRKLNELGAIIIQ